MCVQAHIRWTASLQTDFQTLTPADEDRTGFRWGSQVMTGDTGIIPGWAPNPPLFCFIIAPTLFAGVWIQPCNKLSLIQGFLITLLSYSMCLSLWTGNKLSIAPVQHRLKTLIVKPKCRGRHSHFTMYYNKPEWRPPQVSGVWSWKYAALLLPPRSDSRYRQRRGS